MFLYNVINIQVIFNNAFVDGYLISLDNLNCMDKFSF